MKKDVVITWRPVTATGSTALTLANEKKGEKKHKLGMMRQEMDKKREMDRARKIRCERLMRSKEACPPVFRLCFL